MNNAVKYFYTDDWFRLYLNGALICHGHTLSDYHMSILLRKMGVDFRSKECTAQEMDELEGKGLL